MKKFLNHTKLCFLNIHLWSCDLTYNNGCICNSHASSSQPPLLVQITLPVAITARRDHCAVVFGYGMSFRVVVMFGGFKLKGYPAPNRGGYLSETTLLMLGEWFILPPIFSSPKVIILSFLLFMPFPPIFLTVVSALYSSNDISPLFVFSSTPYFTTTCSIPFSIPQSSVAHGRWPE